MPCPRTGADLEKDDVGGETARECGTIVRYSVMLVNVVVDT